MGLMGLVYGIENLTYNGTFFGTAAGWLFALLLLGTAVTLAAKFVNNQRAPREIRTVDENTSPINGKLVKGFILSENIGNLVAGYTYVIGNHYRNIKEAWVYPEDDRENYSKKVSVKDDDYDRMMQDIRNQNKVEVTVTETTEERKIKLPKLYLKTIASLLCVCLILHTLLPTRQTAIYMAAAYAVQEVLTADKTQKVLGVGYKALENQLGKWANEVPDVADMLVGTGIEYTKKKVVEELPEEVDEE